MLLFHIHLPGFASVLFPFPISIFLPLLTLFFSSKLICKIIWCFVSVSYAEIHVQFHKYHTTLSFSHFQNYSWLLSNIITGIPPSQFKLHHYKLYDPKCERTSQLHNVLFLLLHQCSKTLFFNVWSVDHVNQWRSSKSPCSVHTGNFPRTQFQNHCYKWR